MPAWHPGGRYIAAEHADSVDTDGDGRRDEIFGGIWLVDVETGRTQPLVRGFGAPAWSPDGRHLAMHRGGQIYSVGVHSLLPARADTLTLRQLTTNGANFYPSWSPDGQWIAYDSNVQDSSRPYEIWKMRVEGTYGTNVSRYSGRHSSWSPDGRQLVYARYLVEGGEVVVSDSAGTHFVRLTQDQYSDAFDAPKFSPSGYEIAFVSQRQGPAAVWAMLPDGSQQRRISPPGAWSFDWSPDGQRIVFEYLLDYCFRCGETPPPGNGELWTVNADGTGLRRLTHFTDP